MDIVIRRAEPRDARDLEELFFQLMGERTDYDKLAGRVRLLQGLPQYCLAVAHDREAGRTAGTAMGIVCHDLCKDCRNFMVIENVVVADAYRGRGLGRRLFAFLEEWSREKDCTYSQLVASGHRTGAHSFYESLGYAGEKGFRKWYG